MQLREGIQDVAGLPPRPLCQHVNSVSWFSTGFPLLKAEAYVKLRAPFCINDLSTEHILRSRVRFYEVLKQHGIPVPMHVIVDRSGPIPPNVIESEDYIEVDGVRLAKPFVEKVRRRRRPRRL